MISWLVSEYCMYVLLTIMMRFEVVVSSYFAGMMMMMMVRNRQK